MTGFAEPRYALDRCMLKRLSTDEAADIASRLVQIDPWKTLKTDKDRLAKHTETPNGVGGAWGIFFKDKLVGIVSIKPNWLVGPYLDFLGLVPAAQGEQLGADVLGWMEKQAQLSKARNMFLCVSSFNANAKGFYEKHGFEDVAELEGLLVEEYGEFLMRKRLL